MGNLVPNTFRKAAKPIRQYNIESRVEKILAKEKPMVAPRHPTTQNLLNQGKYPEASEDIHAMNPEFVKRLEQVYVTSEDIKVTPKSDSQKHPTLSKTHTEPTMYGYYEPKEVTYGKVTLKDVLQFISQHMDSPAEWTPKRISEAHNLDLQRTEKILHYYRMYTLVLPATSQAKARHHQATLQSTRNVMGAHAVFQLPPPKKREEKDEDWEWGVEKEEKK